MKLARNIIVILIVALLSQLPQQRASHAWTDQSHDLIARESILFMLRSSNPTVRFVGSVLVSAGEGSRANPDGTRAWPLSQEAYEVDHYEDVALRNIGNTPGVPELMHDLAGLAQFTAYNHFLLYGKRTEGVSFEEYLAIKCGGFNCYTVLEPKTMVQHDNEPGYTVAADDSIFNSTLGTWIYNAGSSGFQDYCYDQVTAVFSGAITDSVEGSITGIPIVGDTINEIYGTLFGSLVDQAALFVAQQVAARLAPMCPYMVGDWDASPAMARYKLNHSEILPEQVTQIAMVDIRWHPVDNMATYGANQLKVAKLFDPVAEFMPPEDLFLKVCPPEDPFPSDACLAYEAEIMAAPAKAVEKYGDSRPWQYGDVLSLGRTIHALSDVAVPGHVSGRLLHPEHLVIESGAKAHLDDFYTYAAGTETTSVTGAVQPAYTISGGTVWELDGIINTEDAETTILAAVVNNPDFATKTMEKLTEDAAMETRDRADYYRIQGKFDNEDVIHPTIRREFMTMAFVNNVLGLIRSVQDYYAAYSSRSWAQMTAAVNWTDADVNLRLQPALDPTYAMTRLQFVNDKSGNYLFDLNVDAFYQEFFVVDGCYVESHDWVTDPVFVETFAMGMDVTFAPDNRGRPDDAIHVTGAYSTNRIDTVYYRENLTSSAGQTVHVPAPAAEQGVAIWCTGPDIWNQWDPSINGADPVQRVICQVAEVRPTGALPCNTAEKLIRDGFPNPPIEIQSASVSTLAADLRISPSVLSKALANAPDKAEITVVRPAPVGRAALIWNDKKTGLRNHVTIGFDGKVVIRRTGNIDLPEVTP